MTTQANLRSKLRSQFIKIDPNAKVWNNDTLDAFLNEAQDQVCTDLNNKLPEQETSAQITTVAGTQEYALPADFIELDTLALGTKRLRKTDKSSTLLMSSSNTSPYNYYLYGGKLGLYPTPDATYTIDYTYYKELPEITSTQECVLPASYNQALCSYAAYLAFNSVSKDDKADRMFANYTNQLTKLSGKYLYQDTDITFPTQRRGNIYNEDTLNME